MNRQQWLEERRTGIGGTDIGAILGLSPYMTAREVWDQKVGLATIEEITSPDMKRGLALEEIIRDEFQEQTGQWVAYSPALARHKEHLWMIGSLDGVVSVGDGSIAVPPDPSDPTLGVWEAKAPRSSVFWRYKREGLPEHMIVQLQWYLLVTGFKWGVWAIFCADAWELLTFEVKADTQLQARLFEEGKKFWECVKSEKWEYDEPMKPAIEMPELAGDDKVLHVEPGDAEWRSLIGAIQEAKQVQADGKEVEAEARASMQTLMGDHTVAEVGGCARVYNRRLPGKRTFDRKALALEHPLIDLTPYMKQGKPYEYFRVYAFKE